MPVAPHNMSSFSPSIEVLSNLGFDNSAPIMIYLLYSFYFAKQNFLILFFCCSSQVQLFICLKIAQIWKIFLFFRGIGVNYFSLGENMSFLRHFFL